MSRIQTSSRPNSSSGSGNKVIATIDFGTAFGPENDTAYVTVSAPWVTSGSVLLATFGGPTTDHDLDDAAVEEIVLTVGNIVPGVSFDIVAHTDHFSWGQYIVNVTGV
jgi:hypothetical protein